MSSLDCIRVILQNYVCARMHVLINTHINTHILIMGIHVNGMLVLVHDDTL